MIQGEDFKNTSVYLLELNVWNAHLSPLSIFFPGSLTTNRSWDHLLRQKEEGEQDTTTHQ